MAALRGISLSGGKSLTNVRFVCGRNSIQYVDPPKWNMPSSSPFLTLCPASTMISHVETSTSPTAMMHIKPISRLSASMNMTARAAVQAAVFEIRDKLDEQIELLVTEAETYNIQIAHGDYYATRDVDWDGMPESDLDEMGREELMELMEDAKEEIAWLVNEISRLEAYICVERQMEQYGEKGRRTVLRPMGRKKRDEEAEASQALPSTS